MLHDRTGLRLNLAKVILSEKAFCIELVDILGARGPRGEPPIAGHDLQSADRRAVARGLGELGLDRVAGEAVAGHCGRWVNRYSMATAR